LIEITRVCKRYPGSERAALDELSLRVPPGTIYGLLGTNGAGKTTLLSILTGVRRKDSGEVRIDGLDPVSDLSAIRRRIGYVPQDLAFYPALTVQENLEIFAVLAGSRAQEVREAIDAAQLADHAGKRAQALSGGLQRRLNLAIGLLGLPKLLLLDEPTAGVDPQSRHFLLETVRRLRARGLTIVYTSHLMEEVQRLCDRVAIIDHGKLVIEGTIAELLAQGDANLEALFLRLTHHELRDMA
jgi:ABC-2 type transport system ATP-binding protein